MGLMGTERILQWYASVYTIRQSEPKTKVISFPFHWSKHNVILLIIWPQEKRVGQSHHQWVPQLYLRLTDLQLPISQEVFLF